MSQTYNYPFIAEYAAKDVLPVLKMAANTLDIEFHRVFLKSARDKLYRACEKFGEGSACDDFREEYDPLFDALSLLTIGLAEPMYLHKNVAHAIHLLESLDGASQRIHPNGV